jgi:cobalt-zinc-cadmium efflux system outer membrane protein
MLTIAETLTVVSLLRRLAGLDSMRFVHLLLAVVTLAGPASIARAAEPVVTAPVESVPAPVPAASAETPVDLETALRWTLSSNPDLVALRPNVDASAAAVAVAQQFPMELNPSLSVDVRPWAFERDSGQGAARLDTAVSVVWTQPIGPGRRSNRLGIAQATYEQTQWRILHAELLALVQTYRLHQTATYRREKLRVARQLAEFNAHLVQTIRRQAEAAQASPPDLVLAEVENQSMQQRLQVAEQQYLDALTDLRKQLGLPEYAAVAVPVGPLTVPEDAISTDEDQLTNIALAGHPEIQAAVAQADISHAAVGLARAERIPVTSVGPLYEIDESGTTFYGLAVSAQVPILNTGRRLVWQREAEHHRDRIAAEQTRVRIAAAVKATLAKSKQTQQLVAEVVDTAKAIESQTQKMERLYTAGQTDLLKLLQVRQRLIDAENAKLDMLWQATQAYADLLVATGATPLLGALPVASDESN